MSTLRSQSLEQGRRVLRHLLFPLRRSASTPHRSIPVPWGQLSLGTAPPNCLPAKALSRHLSLLAQAEWGIRLWANGARSHIGGPRLYIRQIGNHPIGGLHGQPAATPTPRYCLVYQTRSILTSQCEGRSGSNIRQTGSYPGWRSSPVAQSSRPCPHTRVKRRLGIYPPCGNRCRSQPLRGRSQSRSEGSIRHS